MAPLTILYWIWDSHPSEIFEIQIESTKVVYRVKELIKAANQEALLECDVPMLFLFQVSIPILQFEAEVKSKFHPADVDTAQELDDSGATLDEVFAGSLNSQTVYVIAVSRPKSAICGLFF
ncbi:hypothetical protein BDN72DRAFT_847497 [Pluteus cervinus]|uniref:Uncharacterized protein n=1 Tax=Pluteus cervinus TaxID=181527 RepID=A0ACD3ACG5_9AGAR|nr:hypothetical protein BDN72DRAFT_847497 [Pluteus cervinus]